MIMGMVITLRDPGTTESRELGSRQGQDESGQQNHQRTMEAESMLRGVIKKFVD